MPKKLTPTKISASASGASSPMSKISFSLNANEIAVNGVLRWLL